jgi:TolB protein
VADNHPEMQVHNDYPTRSWRVWWFRILILIAFVFMTILAWAEFHFLRVDDSTPVDPTLIALATGLAQTPTPSSSATRTLPSATYTPAPTHAATHGTLVYVSRGAGYARLWAYTIGDPAPIHLTSGDWDDRDPAVSPDGTQIAFSSHRTGNWDLYLLDLQAGWVRQLTDTPGFESHPTWSPDGQWLAYEAYDDGNFDIWILPVYNEQPPIQLTNNLAADLSPTWDPQGRRIAFVSHRDGKPDIFLADLDQPDDRFQNLTNTKTTTERDPAFSPDGSRLAYSAQMAGLDMIMIQDLDHLDYAPLNAGQGRGPVWSPDGSHLAIVLHTPNETYLQTLTLERGNVTPLSLPTTTDVLSLSWSAKGMPGELYISENAQPSASPLYTRQIDTADSDIDRLSLIDLPGVTAPRPSLSDAVDEAFNALRARVKNELGWDFLVNLENAFVGLNDPLPPGFAYNDWLYTGRAFAFNQAAVDAGWVELVREDFGGRTYWRVYVRAAVQDGSLGEPLRDDLWDFSTRYEGDPQAYDQGGSLKSQITEGFYVDFTQLASDYGFERLPAMANWRTYYPGARFNEFVLADGLDWTDAMLELYPASAIVTPTPYQTPTPTATRTLRPTPTPWWWRWRTPTPTPIPLQPTMTSTP